MTAPLLGLLTGPVGIGKTTVAERVASLARQQGLACEGLLAPAILDDHGHKVGIWGVDVGSGERRTLARTDRELGGPRVGPYFFDAAALAWAVGTVERAMLGQSAAAFEPCHLIIIDEIGKLELWHGGGLAPLLSRLAAGEAKRCLLVVRDSLLAELQARLGSAEQVVFCLDEENRSNAPRQIVEELCRRRSARSGRPPYGAHCSTVKSGTA